MMLQLNILIPLHLIQFDVPKYSVNWKNCFPGIVDDWNPYQNIMACPHTNGFVFETMAKDHKINIGFLLLDRKTLQEWIKKTLH